MRERGKEERILKGFTLLCLSKLNLRLIHTLVCTISSLRSSYLSVSSARLQVCTTPALCQFREAQYSPWASHLIEMKPSCTIAILGETTHEKCGHFISLKMGIHCHPLIKSHLRRLEKPTLLVTMFSNLPKALSESHATTKHATSESQSNYRVALCMFFWRCRFLMRNSVHRSLDVIFWSCSCVVKLQPPAPPSEYY